jgi:SAM-dependent methyltransferase
VQESWPERIDVGETVHDHNEEEHRARYVWAAALVTGRILDVACGTGHGSALLAARGEVVGVDRDDVAVARARARVPDGDFELANIPPLPFGDDRFDAAVSFETLEHIRDDRGFAAELRRVVRNGGLVLISSPNRAATSPNTSPPPNPYHVREYLLPDFVELMHAAGFPEVEVWHQRRERQWMTEHLAAAVLARFPRLCVTGTWWDRLGHGTGDVERWAPEIKWPSLWVLACR